MSNLLEKIFYISLILLVSACGVRKDVRPVNETQKQYGVPKYELYKSKYKDNRILKY